VATPQRDGLFAVHETRLDTSPAVRLVGGQGHDSARGEARGFPRGARLLRWRIVGTFLVVVGSFAGLLIGLFTFELCT